MEPAGWRGWRSTPRCTNRSRASTRLARDHYIRLDGNDYLVDPGVLGRRVEILAGLHQVRVLCDGRLVADHQRLWAKHQTVSNPVHVEPAKLLWRKHLGAARRTVASEVEARRLAELWSHEEFLVACLQRDVSARESHGGEGRIPAARFPARKSLEEFDFDHARGLKRDVLAHLGTLGIVAAKENVVFLGPPGAGKPRLAIGLAMRACQARAPRRFRRRRVGRPTCRVRLENAQALYM